MATLDSLQSELDALKERVSTVEEQSSNNATTITQHTTLLTQHSNKLTEHETRLDDHDTQLEDHDTRLHTLEDAEIQMTIIRSVKSPIWDSEKKVIGIYMPDDLTLEDFEAVNQNVEVAMNFNWFRKISNSVGKGKVCFDFDRAQGIKSILLGPNTRLMIPTGLIITSLIPEKSTLKVINSDDVVVNKGLNIGIDIITSDTEEAVISIGNYTPGTIHLYRGEILCSLAQVFQYKVSPVITIKDIGD